MPEQITQGTIRGLNTELSTLFLSTLEEVETTPLLTRATVEVPTTKKFVDYAWMWNLGHGMREWIGEREIQDGFELDEYLIANRTFEETFRVAIEDIEDGVYAFKSQFQTQGLVDSYIRRKEDLILDLIFGAFGARPEIGNEASYFQAGSALLGPDGKPLFAVDHAQGALKRIRSNGTETYAFEEDGTWSNLTTAAFTKDALKAARTYLRKLKGRYGEYVRMNPDLLVVGPDNEDAAVEAVSPAVITRVEGAGGAEETRQQIVNPLGNYAEVMVVNEFGDSGAWMLFDTSKRMKPFIFQNRTPLQFQRTGNIGPNAAEGLVDPTVFHQDAILYGSRARMGAGYGNPTLAFGSIGDDTVVAGDALS